MDGDSEIDCRGEFEALTFGLWAGQGQTA